MTFKDFRSVGEKKYKHVFDGGNSDNLGLTSVKDIIDANDDRYERVVIILIDAYTKSKGVKSTKSDGRGFLDYGVDLNFIDATDSLLTANREEKLRRFEDTIRKMSSRKKVIFYQINFSDIKKDKKLRENLNNIRTDFKLKKDEPGYLDEAVEQLIVKDNDCLQDIKKILLLDNPTEIDTICTWPLN